MKFQFPRKITSRLLGVTSIVSSATLIPLSVVTIPPGFNTPVQAQTPNSTPCCEIKGAIFDKWSELGGSNSPLGNPISNELPVARGGQGRFNAFQYGFIYWHPKIGAYGVWGAIGEKWNELGRDKGLGFPITDELATADGAGRYNDFERNASIYWHPDTGAHAVYGDIRAKWISLGREKSRLGYPISDELPVGTAGQRVSHFQNGSIYWNSGTRETIVNYKNTPLANPRLNPVKD